MTYTTWNEAYDTERLNILISSMEINGWMGAPLVSWCDFLITGSHRYAAAQAVGIEVPTIEIDEVYAEAGLNFSELHAEAGYPTIDEITGSGMFERLPEWIIEKYGVQW